MVLSGALILLAFNICYNCESYIYRCCSRTLYEFVLEFEKFIELAFARWKK